MKPTAPRRRLNKKDFYETEAKEASSSCESAEDEDDDLELDPESKPIAPRIQKHTTKRKKKVQESSSSEEDDDASDISNLIASEEEEIDEARDRAARAEVDRMRDIGEEDQPLFDGNPVVAPEHDWPQSDPSEEPPPPETPPPPPTPEPDIDDGKPSPPQKRALVFEELVNKPAPAAAAKGEAAAAPPPRMLAPKKHKADAAGEAEDEPQQQQQPPLEGEVAEDLPEHSMQELRYHPHFHICLWYSKIAVSNRKGETPEYFIDFNLIQQRLRTHFLDVLVSQVRQQSRLFEIIGAERYWLIAHDCTLVSDFLRATNAQTAPFQFRIGWEHLYAHKIKHIPYWEQQYDHYLWAMRTKVKGRKGFLSLSDRYDRARELTDAKVLAMIQVPGGYSERTSFNLKLRSYLLEHNIKLKRTPQGDWQAFKLIDGMTYSYSLYCSTLEQLKASLISISEGWNNEVTKYANGNWNTEFGAQALGNFPLLKRDWHWVEFAPVDRLFGYGGGWFYIVDDPNLECDNASERRKLIEKYCKEEHRQAQGDFYRNLPKWWPLPGFTTCYREDGTPYTRTYENGFLYRDSIYHCPITKRDYTMVEFVGERLKDEKGNLRVCGFYDQRPGKMLLFDQPDTEAGDARWTGPPNWLSLVEPYKCEPCPAHTWERHSSTSPYWRCTTKIGNRCCSLQRVKGAGDSPPAERERLCALGPEFWVFDLMDVFRGAIEVECWVRKRSLMIYGDSSLGKSTVMAPFTDNKGCLFPRDAFFVSGDGTKADVLAGLADDSDIKIAVFEDFDPIKSFPEVSLLKVFLDGGKIGARKMRQNTTRVDVNFPKFFNANPKYIYKTIQLITGKKDEKHEVKRRVLAPGHDPNKKDAGNPFGPHYDVDNALSNRVSVIRWNIKTSDEMDTTLRERVIEESIDILVYLARLRYVPLQRRSKWTQARQLRRHERTDVTDS